MLPVFRIKQIFTFSFLNIRVSHHLVSPVNPTESNTELSKEELKQQLQEALEVTVTNVLLLKFAFLFNVAQCSVSVADMIIACPEPWMDSGS